MGQLVFKWESAPRSTAGRGRQPTYRDLDIVLLATVSGEEVEEAVLDCAIVASEFGLLPDSLRAHVLPDQAFMTRGSFRARVLKSLYVSRQASTLDVRIGVPCR